jgi:hypothetical protein
MGTSGFNGLIIEQLLLTLVALDYLCVLSGVSSTNSAC